MTKVIKDSLTLYQTNHIKTNEQNPLLAENVQIADQKEAVINELSHGRRTVLAAPRLTLKQAELLSGTLAHDIPLEPKRSLSAHRLTHESLALLAD